ncbi:MAG TPA: MoxR family ATPase [Anaerolineaceae bacterium]|nr:MoxR family ATPase [Anaerolineaceae bacterium]
MPTLPETTFTGQNFVATVTENIERVIVGKRQVIEMLMVALLCEGHVLLEDVPGVGKTMLARSLATSLRGQFKRLQCTPDLLPNDITGVSVYNQQNGQFEFRSGPIFVNVLLVDEINRATPRTQAALLEAMQEQQVTVDGVTYPLPRPFLVIATQNPVEYEGTFPLPEAQLDRFLMRLLVGYPSKEDERHLLTHLSGIHPINNLQPVVDGSLLLELQRQVWDVFVEDSLQDYIIALVTATRQHPDIMLGASPRASLALYKASQALAAVRGRDHVIPDDIQQLVAPILTHRLLISPEAELRGRTAPSLITEILESTPLKLNN